MMRRHVFFLYFLFLIAYASGQVHVPFAQRYGATERGNITFISNTSVHCDGTGNCANFGSQVPPMGNGSNNGKFAAYVDIDNDSSTFSSSSDSLRLSSCAEILFAELYWGGGNNPSDSNHVNRDQVLLKVDTGTYISLLADTMYSINGVYDAYQCRKNITSLMQNHPTVSKYTVANVFSEVGVKNRFGGWNIVVVYKDELLSRRNLTVFEGRVDVQKNSVTDVTVNGFLTPISGPVTFEVGVFSYEGDRSLKGDQLLFDGGNGFVNVFDTLNPIDNIFNSSFTNKGKVNTSQDPLFMNSLSLDSDIFLPDNSANTYIGNSATSATTRVTTTGDLIMLQVITMAIDVNEPDIRTSEIVEDLNGGDVEMGDTLEYSMKGVNTGSIYATNTIILDTLAHNITYIPESIVIVSGSNPGNKTDILGDDEAEYDSLNRVVKIRVGNGANQSVGGVFNQNTDSVHVKFRVKVTDNCMLLNCDNTIDNRMLLIGTNPSNGNIHYNSGMADEFGCSSSIGTSLVADHPDCIFPQDTTVSSFCGNTDFFDLGYMDYIFFDTTFHAVNEPSYVGTYYAIKTTNTDCSDTIVINLMSYNDCPPFANTDFDTIPEDTQHVYFNLLWNDLDEDQNINPAATLILSNTAGSQIINNLDGSIDYSTPPEYVGIDTVLYKTCDQTLPNPQCDIDTFFVFITPVTDTLWYQIDEKETVQVCADELTDFGTPATTLNSCANPLNGNVQIINTCLKYTISSDVEVYDSLCVVSCKDTLCDTTLIFIHVVVEEVVKEDSVYFEILFEIPQGFSPNGDGVNDQFVIKGIQYFPKNTFKVFNRWGNLVYEKEGYLNEWDGTSQHHFSLSKEPLPAGTYFYILELNDGNKTYKGFLYLNR